MGTSPIEVWLYPMLTTGHEGLVQSSPWTEDWGPGAGGSGTHPHFGGVPGGPDCTGEHVALPGPGGGQLPSVPPCGCKVTCWLPPCQLQALWLFGVPPPTYSPAAAGWPPGLGQMEREEVTGLCC